MKLPDGMKGTGLVAFYLFRERLDDPQQVPDLVHKNHGFLGRLPERDNHDPIWVTEPCCSYFARFKRATTLRFQEFWRPPMPSLPKSCTAFAPPRKAAAEPCSAPTPGVRSRNK